MEVQSHTLVILHKDILRRIARCYRVWQLLRMTSKVIFIRMGSFHIFNNRKYYCDSRRLTYYQYILEVVSTMGTKCNIWNYNIINCWESIDNTRKSYKTDYFMMHTHNYRMIDLIFVIRNVCIITSREYSYNITIGERNLKLIAAPKYTFKSALQYIYDNHPNLYSCITPRDHTMWGLYTTLLEKNKITI